ncbi:hypothetical protein HanXRQr2_Chr02g0085531 [Helianthus annuus]|uniref:Uncharacterized protein n=1 Tax=Helianthus annuus TaxID=4232 RepID=A0A9K3JS13_HELAN|nr:hypothetical protein HanXRQr2_Chr02g0085531 [Helianthus annuus]KAJ0953338.1 hypothetical protein HanPSC8_Chr02g0082681 [Helianthus annuus]
MFFYDILRVVYRFRYCVQIKYRNVFGKSVNRTHGQFVNTESDIALSCWSSLYNLSFTFVFVTVDGTIGDTLRY